MGGESVLEVLDPLRGGHGVQVEVKLYRLGWTKWDGGTWIGRRRTRSAGPYCVLEVLDPLRWGHGGRLRSSRTGWAGPSGMGAHG